MSWSIWSPPWRGARALWGEAYRDASTVLPHLGAVAVTIDPSAGLNLAAMVAIAVAMFAVMPCLFMIAFHICNRIQERARPLPCCLCCHHRVHPNTGFESVVVAGVRDPLETTLSSGAGSTRLSRTGRRSHSLNSFADREAQRTGGSGEPQVPTIETPLQYNMDPAAMALAPPDNDVVMFEGTLDFDAAAAELMMSSDPRRTALHMTSPMEGGVLGRQKRGNSSGGFFVDASLARSFSGSSTLSGSGRYSSAHNSLDRHADKIVYDAGSGRAAAGGGGSFHSRSQSPDVWSTHSPRSSDV